MKARAIPVFPLVGSIIVEPGFKRPSSSAWRSILKAMRSLTLPPGLKDSSFTTRSAPVPRESRCNLSSGVFPIKSVRFEAILAIFIPP
ncbi:MAG: hypothetical protein BWY80_00870 [Firmicutes bacterium ADurb.Bin456]|nr:MAG: hypothetical protein BWY80_00870 [Firmicutes bacterium ADurb.Bin456]